MKCPRCNGFMGREWDEHGSYSCCWSCGFIRYDTQPVNDLPPEKKRRPIESGGIKL